MKGRFRLFLFFLFFQYWLHAQLSEIKSFGENEGNLSMWIFIPSSYSADMSFSLVVAMHGCSQSAETFSMESGWIELAQKNGFIVLFPEQKSSNNITKCFNWFRENDTSRNGESASIYEMIQYTKSNYSVDPNNVFSYGISAGGAMSSALMAQYPETFNTGAVIAAGGYGLCKNAIDAYQLMQNGSNCCQTNSEYANYILSKNSSDKTYPKLIVLYGTQDKTVNPINSIQLIQQWQGIFESKKIQLIETVLPQFENESVTKSLFCDADGNPLIISYKIENLAHLLPVNPGNQQKMGGKTGKYTIDFDFHSTYFIAKDFGIIQ